MNKSNLGKIVVLVLFFINSLFANVTAQLDSPAIYKGDVASITISASGDDVSFPNITDIDGFRVLGVSSSSSTSIINGTVSRNISKTYSFIPTHSVTIKPFVVTVDGKEYKTKNLYLKVLEPKASVMGDKFLLKLSLDKQKVYVGENVVLSMQLYQRVDAKASKIELTQPKIENIWIKQIPDQVQTTKGDYIVTTYKFILTPQKDGNFTIPSQIANIGTAQKQRMSNFFNDPFFDSFNTVISYKKIYSNNLSLEVKPLPNDIDIYGKFSLKADVDKTNVEANKPVNLTITIQGEGNLEDIKEFSLDIPQAVIYSDKPIVKTSLQNNSYSGIFTQKVAIIADENYTIPSIEFSYFDKELKKEVTRRTTPIAISVKQPLNSIKNTNYKDEPKLETMQPISSNSSNSSEIYRDKTSQKDDTIKLIVVFSFGLFMGLFIKIFYDKYSKSSIKVEQPILKQIRKYKKDSKKLFELLLPYKGSSDYIDEVLDLLEENLYNGKNNKIDILRLEEEFINSAIL